MTDSRNAERQLLPDADRLTRLDWFLRAASLDELPELFNILKDDMSIVGQRPLLWNAKPKNSAINSLIFPSSNLLNFP